MTGQLIGYARVSSNGQSLEVQRDLLAKAQCVKVFEEKVSARTIEKRPQLSELIGYAREGDTVVITKLDRLARSVRDLQNLIFDFKAKGITLRVLDQSIDTSTAAGKAFLDMLCVFAEFETNIRAERQQAGVRKAIEEGRFNPGRPKTLPRAAVKELHEQGVPPAGIAKQLKVSRQGVHNVLAELGLTQLSKTASEPASIFD